MIILDKVTTRYIAHEDRIALTGEGERCGIVRLWLIRPLTQKLVTALVDGVKPSHADARYAELIDSFAQSKAEESQKPMTAVEYSPGGDEKQNRASPQKKAAKSPPGLDSMESPPPKDEKSDQEWLVSSINLKILEGKFVLTFFGEADRKAGFMLTEEHLRQWLGILRDACSKGEWTSPDWPEWMRTGAGREDDTSSVH